VASPWGCRGGACRKGRRSRLTKRPRSPNHGTYRVRITRKKEVFMMAAKKKAAKKAAPAKKKAAKKK
jgi:hypothetical protein